MRDSRQITVLRSLFRTLHPALTSGLKSGLEPAKRMLAGAYQRPVPGAPEAIAQAIPEKLATAATPKATPATTPKEAKPQALSAAPEKSASPVRAAASQRSALPSHQSLPPLPRTLTDEHLVAELEHATQQFDGVGTDTRKPARKPARSRRHHSRDTLLSLLEEAKVRIQVLETELELARGTEEHIPLLTEEWSDD